MRMPWSLRRSTWGWRPVQFQASQALVALTVGDEARVSADAKLNFSGRSGRLADNGRSADPSLEQQESGGMFNRYRLGIVSPKPQPCTCKHRGSAVSTPSSSPILLLTLVILLEARKQRRSARQLQCHQVQGYVPRAIRVDCGLIQWTARARLPNSTGVGPDEQQAQGCSDRPQLAQEEE